MVAAFRRYIDEMTFAAVGLHADGAFAPVLSNTDLDGRRLRHGHDDGGEKQGIFRLNALATRNSRSTDLESVDSSIYDTS